MNCLVMIEKDGKRMENKFYGLSETIAWLIDNNAQKFIVVSNEPYDRDGQVVLAQRGNLKNVKFTPFPVTPEPKEKKDVHTEHCCEEHKRCKYCEEDCPVATGRKHASYGCNCAWM